MAQYYLIKNGLVINLIVCDNLSFCDSLVQDGTCDSYVDASTIDQAVTEFNQPLPQSTSTDNSNGTN